MSERIIKFSEMEAHPCAAVWPTLSTEEKDEMLESIRLHGLINNITAQEKRGQFFIIDGLQRIRAAKESGRKEFREGIPESRFDFLPATATDEDISLRVIALNKHRRHLSAIKRADCAIDTLQAAGMKIAGQGESDDGKKITAEKVAKASGTSEPTARRALKKRRQPKKAAPKKTAQAPAPAKPNTANKPANRSTDHFDAGKMKEQHEAEKKTIKEKHTQDLALVRTKRDQHAAEIKALKKDNRELAAKVRKLEKEVAAKDKELAKLKGGSTK